MHVTDGHTLGETGWVIQSHVIAMYLPALLTGYLVGRLGVLRVMSVGVVVLFACVVLAVVDRSLMHYWGALVLLGLGWNLLFVAGTTLLTQSYHPAERYRAQAVNDFIIFGTQAFASLTAGAVIALTSWKVLNLINLPFLLLLLGAILVLRHRLARPTQGRLLAIAGGQHTGR
jgi:MFS family permease